jgi:pyruvate dehydrogenase E2 component (dihydrolipoamide acetyltransferase)
MANAIEVKVPDIGDFKNIPVIEILVKPGDTVSAEDPLVTLESDKATMEVPSPAAGTVKEIRIKVGDKVSEGALVLMLEPGGEAQAAAPKAAPAPAVPALPAAAAQQPVQPAPAPAAKTAPAPAPAVVAVDEAGFGKAHASPSVRRFARELGVDLSRVKGSGPKDRVVKEDVQDFVKSELSKPRGAEGGGGLGFNLPPMQPVDFAKFGPVTTQPLSRIKKLGQHPACHATR